MFFCVSVYNGCVSMCIYVCVAVIAISHFMYCIFSFQGLADMYYRNVSIKSEQTLAHSADSLSIFVS